MILRTTLAATSAARRTRTRSQSNLGKISGRENLRVAMSIISQSSNNPAAVQHALLDLPRDAPRDPPSMPSPTPY